MAAQAGAEIVVDRGRKEAVRPASLNPGTSIEVVDLFSATPARLKFLRSEPAENGATADVVKRLAMAHPGIGFSLTSGERASLRLPAVPATSEGLLKRLARIMGTDFLADSLEIAAEREGVRLAGYIGLPTLNRANQGLQFLFVNGRPVRDKLMLGAIRGAYGDVMARGRHPLLALFVDLDPQDVDVNVHPAKSEVRFRDGGRISALIVGTIRDALGKAGHRSSAMMAGETLAAVAERRANGGTAALAADFIARLLVRRIAAEPALSADLPWLRDARHGRSRAGAADRFGCRPERQLRAGRHARARRDPRQTAGRGPRATA